jgi:hypothetical protein
MHSIDRPQAPRETHLGIHTFDFCQFRITLRIGGSAFLLEVARLVRTEVEEELLRTRRAEAEEIGLGAGNTPGAKAVQSGQDLGFQAHPGSSNTQPPPGGRSTPSTAPAVFHNVLKHGIRHSELCDKHAMLFASWLRGTGIRNHLAILVLGKKLCSSEAAIVRILRLMDIMSAGAHPCPCGAGVRVASQALNSLTYTHNQAHKLYQLTQFLQALQRRGALTDPRHDARACNKFLRCDPRMYLKDASRSVFGGHRHWICALPIVH